MLAAQDADVVLGVRRRRNLVYERLYVADAADGLQPAWLSVDKAECKAEVLHVPSREELAPVVNEQLIVELYSK